MKNPESLDQKDLAYLIGFFRGDGYFTYGRIGIDTISPDVANKLVEILSDLSSKKIKIEVYGNPEKFSQILQNDSLQYPKRNSKHSDYVKIRIDSVEFSNAFKTILTEFEKNMRQLAPEIICKYIQGFFDAEAYVSPQGTIEIDMCRTNEKSIELKKLMEKTNIKYQTMTKGINSLIKENKLEKIKKQKRIFLELSPNFIPVGK